MVLLWLNWYAILGNYGVIILRSWQVRLPRRSVQVHTFIFGSTGYAFTLFAFIVRCTRMIISNQLNQLASRRFQSLCRDCTGGDNVSNRWFARRSHLTELKAKFQKEAGPL